ncbi:TPA: hypothetical protein ACJ2OB_002340 [Klebsiella pneumoniae]
MTSKFTREQLIKKAQEQIAFCRHTKITGEGLAHVNQCAALFEIALAAMDSEPVAVTDDMAYAFHHALTDSMIGADDVEEIKTGLRAVFANLTAPVVSAEYPDRLPCSVLLEPGLRFGKGIKTSTMLAALARRAVYESDLAALSPEEKAEFQARIEDFKALIAQPVPVVPQDVLEALQKVARIRLDLNDFDGDRRGIADCLGDAEEALIEVVNRRAAMLHAGNSPAQSDCCPAQNSVAPAQSPIDHGYRPGCECSGCKATARICADLSANSPANPGCWCRTCRPVVLNDMRFVVCPDCGNKRCPRANDHRNACTGSNEPGQEGSAYPSAPQEVKP